MSKLPIESVIPQLLNALQLHQQVILCAEPGAGKSTYLPLQLCHSDLISGKIVMLEPRRLAARNIAHYLAKQLGEPTGQRVGYRVRGESKVSHSTQLEIVTEGIMTRMLQSDPELNGIDLIIFDEFHERTIHADTSLAFALESQSVFRPDLKLLVMSATLDPVGLQKLLPEAQYVSCEGRHYPIDIRYAPLDRNSYLAPTVARQIKLSLAQDTGSILVFLPGVGAIKQLLSLLEDVEGSVDVCPLYGQLSFSAQQRAIAPSAQGRRRVVLATNIAETSLTIEGIRVVIDSGLERIAQFDIKTGITKLTEQRISQASAKQRAGRAGRTESGTAVRLYSQSQLAQQPAVAAAEILQADLSGLCLELAQWGVSDPQQLTWLDCPPQSAIEQGYGLLERLALVTKERQLTPLGEQAQRLGIAVRLAAMLLRSLRGFANESDPDTVNRGAAYQQQDTHFQTSLALIALLEEPERNVLDMSHSLYRLKLGRHSKQSILLKRAQAVAEKLGRQFSLNRCDESEIGACLALAFPDRIGQNRGDQSGRFVLANGHGAFIDNQESLAASPYVIAVDLMRTRQDASHIFVASTLDMEQLQAQQPDLFCDQEVVYWDDKKGRLITEQQRQLGALVIDKQAGSPPDQAQINQAMIDYIRRKGLAVLAWNRESSALLERLRCGAAWFTEERWPALSDEALLVALEDWLLPYLGQVNRVNQLAQLDLEAALRAYIGWPLNQQIDTLLPSHYQFATGTKKRIQYQLGSPPMLSIKLQEVFGEERSPMIADNRQRVVLELLSPAQRPLQITSDLAAFWQGAYKEVQKEMKGRYPKHPWPDDPAHHIATRKTKRQLNL